jgi:transcriptional regulator with XRE-family HTH domain
VEKTDFGRALRDLRRERKLSLRDVSDATGISSSFLSLVENGKSDITIGRLMTLARFFDVHVSDLLPPGTGRDPIVIRGEERRHIGSPSEGIDLYLLGPDSERRFLPILVEFQAESDVAEFVEHEGEEYIYVFEGRVSLEVEGHEPVVLERGDGAYYRADRPHLFRSADGKRAIVFSVVAPPHL